MEIFLIILLVIVGFIVLSLLGWGGKLLELVFSFFSAGFWGFWGCLLKIAIVIFIIYMVASVL
jgi:hypothetical protein